MTGPELLGPAVHRQLRRLVLDGELEPGAPLSVPALSVRLGVSRSPVREAVQQLIAEGLAVTSPNAGARIAVLDDRRIRDVLAVRSALDGLAAAAAATRLTEAELGLLAGLLSAQEANLRAAADPDRDTAADLEFHAFIRDRCENPVLAGELARLEAQAHLYRGELWQSPINRRSALREHRRIVEALESGRPAAARAAAEAHVCGLITRLDRG
ncbi:GntR family transcriptional regulator [Nocardia sp. BMG111209]|uniref:GntR family transcriptional regulator n=1 Tax=Nocardia sp. BMG111209 TaxID=1160137 RepID=UPI000361DC32|nr:GntR family transcriptional regulator [Nocardia sp. BMG111209]